MDQIIAAALGQILANQMLMLRLMTMPYTDKTSAIAEHMDSSSDITDVLDQLIEAKAE